MHKNPIARALAAITVGNAVLVENLTMVPLVAKSAASAVPEYVVLDEALGSSAAEITEISDHGSIPELRFVNRGKHPVLVVDGEELLGAKQNRIVNLTILVAAHSTLTIPVSCVEAGRWRARSASFASASRTQYATGRAKRMAQVTRSIVDDGERLSDQPAVWADIAEKSARMHAKSPTSAMEQIYTDHAASIDTYVAGCTPIEGQVGALFAIGDRIVGFDLFDSADTFRKLLPKLVRSYAVDAIDAGTGTPAATPVSRLIPGFLAAVAAAPQQNAAAVGLGEDVRLGSNGVVGAALVVDKQVVHLSGFVS